MKLAITSLQPITAFAAKAWFVCGTFVALAILSPVAHADIMTQCYGISQGVTTVPEDGQQSHQECKERVISCTQDNGAQVSWSSTRVLVQGSYRVCSPGFGASKEVIPSRIERKGSPATTAPIVPPATIAVTPNSAGEERKMTVKSGPKDSGPRADWSQWYDLCSPALPAGFRIHSSTFRLEGDRQCGAWGECRQITSGSDRVCWQFRMQGHNEGGPMMIGNPNEGRRESEGYLELILRNY